MISFMLYFVRSDSRVISPNKPTIPLMQSSLMHCFVTFSLPIQHNFKIPKFDFLHQGFFYYQTKKKKTNKYSIRDFFFYKTKKTNFIKPEHVWRKQKRSRNFNRSIKSKQIQSPLDLKIIYNLSGYFLKPFKKNIFFYFNRSFKKTKNKVNVLSKNIVLRRVLAKRKQRVLKITKSRQDFLKAYIFFKPISPLNQLTSALFFKKKQAVVRNPNPFISNQIYKDLRNKTITIRKKPYMFSPGYRSVWPKLRLEFFQIFKSSYFRQYKVNKMVNCFFKINALSIVNSYFYNILTFKKTFSFFFLKPDSVYLNGRLSKTTNIRLKLGDILFFYNKYFFYSSKDLNHSFKGAYKKGYIVSYFKESSFFFNYPNKKFKYIFQNSRRINDFFKFYEFDFFTSTFIIIYEPWYFFYTYNSFFSFFSNYSIFRMYNWKYINLHVI